MAFSYVCAKSLESNSLRPHGLQPTRLLCPWGFSRQEYWSGLPCPPPGDLPQPGIEATSRKSPVLAGGFFTTEPPGKPPILLYFICISAVIGRNRSFEQSPHTPHSEEDLQDWPCPHREGPCITLAACLIWLPPRSHLSLPASSYGAGRLTASVSASAEVYLIWQFEGVELHGDTKSGACPAADPPTDYDLR